VRRRPRWRWGGGRHDGEEEDRSVSGGAVLTKGGEEWAAGFGGAMGEGARRTLGSWWGRELWRHFFSSDARGGASLSIQRNTEGGCSESREGACRWNECRTVFIFISISNTS
jgi:hypothetical protein